MPTSLIKKHPKRLFTFGCSFTGHNWPTWANILAYDLEIPHYNYGQGGAGNQFVFNMLMQADSYYNFGVNDLVMIAWTNVAREDRYIKNKGWITPGNIYTQNIYPNDYVINWADDYGYAIRDFAVIKAAQELLAQRKCQFHNMKMIDFCRPNDWNFNSIKDFQSIENLYTKYLSKIEKSFFEILWNNDLNYKFNLEKMYIDKRYKNGHPTVVEHFKYLETIFDHNFSNKTKDKVIETDRLVIEKIRHYLNTNDIPSWEMRFDELFFSKQEPFFVL